MSRWIGIDFSGDVQMWTPGCGRSNVWIAEIAEDSGRLELVDLRRVQQLPGSMHPFERLAGFCRTTDADAISIDAPFSVPRQQHPPGGYSQLLRDVSEFPRNQRPFARGETLVGYAESQSPLDQAKPLRETERNCRDKGINVRSTLWNGARGGAAFTVACMTLIEATGLATWPWSPSGAPLLVEAFPAAQLERWRLPRARYDKEPGVREQILAGLDSRVKVDGPLRELALSSADALDAIICAFAGRAVAMRTLASEPAPDAHDEGWIAVHR